MLRFELFCSMPESSVQQIEADIAETERLMTELRVRIAMSQSAGEDTTESEQRLQDMFKGWMLLQDQRQKAVGADQRAEVAEQIISTALKRAGQAASANGQAHPAVHP
jgi:hypothetical protein